MKKFIPDKRTTVWIMSTSFAYTVNRFKNNANQQIGDHFAIDNLCAGKERW